MIKRLKKNMLVEFNFSGDEVSWRLIITDKGTRDIYLSPMYLKKIRKWEAEFKDQKK